MDNSLLISVLSKFGIDPENIVFTPVSHGYINDSFFVNKSGETVYVLQRLNNQVFKDPIKIQKNIDLALEALVAHDYTKLEFIRSLEHKTLVKNETGYWRLVRFIPGSKVFDTPTGPEMAKEAGRLLGRFHSLTEKLDTEDFEITLPGFLSLQFRLEEYRKAMESTSLVRKERGKKQMEFVELNLEKFEKIPLQNHPLRLCHNDTKLNNILFDHSGRAICFIDLDTLMPGYFLYDFGDAIRTVVNPVSEDETDLSKIEFRLDLFVAFIKGIKESELRLSNEEISALPLASAYSPFLHGLRALTDYLNGNVYYRVRYEEHNLDRAKNLFSLTRKSLEIKDKLQQIIKKVYS